MNSIKSFIIEVESRPSLYLGERSLKALKSFIDGWVFGADDRIEDSYLLDDFQKWTEKRFNIRESQSWSRIILFHSIDEYDALNNFFRLFKEFFSTYDKK